MFTFEEEAVLGEGVVGARVAVDGADHGDVAGLGQEPGLGATDKHHQRHEPHGSGSSRSRHCGNEVSRVAG